MGGSTAAPDRRWPRWLIARRTTQGLLLAAFAGAPWWGPRWVQGTLASSVWFGTLPLTDPFVALQALLAGQALAVAGALGALLVAIAFALSAGRLYCGWVCPINLVTDAADALRRALGLRRGLLPGADRRLRYVVLMAVLLASALAGSLVWEAINPITHAVRALAFGLWTSGAVAVAAVFAFDLVLLRHGWCGHLCPVGAFYGLLGRFAWLRMRAERREACNDCADCYAVCPEPLVIKPALKAVDGAGPVILGAQCTNCARCIDVCSKDVFAFGARRPNTSTPRKESA